MNNTSWSTSERVKGGWDSVKTSGNEAIDLIYSTGGRIFDTVQGSMNAPMLSDFIDTVNWKEPFITSLIAFQITLMLFTYFTRRKNTIQFMIMTCLTIVGLFAQQLNELGRSNWKSFATQDYFDRSGLFFLIFITGPFIGMGLRLVKTYAKKKRRENIAKQSTSSSSTMSGAASNATQSQSENKKDS